MAACDEERLSKGLRREKEEQGALSTRSQVIRQIRSTEECI